jgi:hypothetical protein
MADIAKLTGYINAYGTAVRAGVLTPSLDDEIHIREVFGLPVVNESIRTEWARTNGVRQPITLAQDSAVEIATIQAEAQTPQ